MAHNLAFDEKSGEAALYLLKEKAWHGLGQVVEEAKTSEEVIKLAHLDWEVKKTPNFTFINDQYVETGSISTYRSDNNSILGNRMTDRYEVMQNKQAFEYMDSLVMCDKDIQYQTAGALNDGKVTFVTAKLPKYLRIKGSDDIIEQYLLLTNTHDASAPLMVCFTPIIVVCNNTLNAAFRSNSNSVIIRHTQSLTNRLAEGRHILNLQMEYSDKLQEVLTHLTHVKVNDTLAKQIIQKTFLTSEELAKLSKGEDLSTRKANTMADILGAINNAPGQDLHRGTALHVYNGITSYFQNVKSYKSDSRKMQGVMINGQEMMESQKALNLLLAL